MFCIAYWGGVWEKKMCFLSNKKKKIIEKETHCRNKDLKKYERTDANKVWKNGDSTLEYLQE